MTLNLYSNKVSVVLIGTCFFLLSCSAQKDELGAEIRKSLGVTKDTIEETENSIEKHYDPQVILKRAEAYYEEKEFMEAIGEYRHFVDLHPLHQWSDYALFKLGMSHFRQMKTIDRDPEPVRKALETFEKLLSVYPQTDYREEAKEKIKDCREALAKHEFYVGHFYYKKTAYPAAIARFRQLLETYPDLPQAEEALYYLGLTFHDQGKNSEALSHFEKLLDRYPETPHRKDVQQLLARINGMPNP